MRRGLGLALCAAATSPFTWPELEDGIQRRKKVFSQLQNEFMRERKKQLDASLQHLPWLDYAERRAHFRKNPFEGSGHLFDLRSGRVEYMEKFGCIRINQDAICAIKRLNMPIVEIGAGFGHWARVLTDHGVKVEAIDSKLDLPPVRVVSCIKGAAH